MDDAISFGESPAPIDTLAFGPSANEEQRADDDENDEKHDEDAGDDYAGISTGGYQISLQ